VWRSHPAYNEAHKEARDRANAKPRQFERRSKRVSLMLTVMRANVGAGRVVVEA
jgi:hypothetical protein